MNKKKSILLYVVIILLVCGIVFLIYDKNVSEKKYNESLNTYKTNVKKLENQVSSLKEKSKDIDISFLVGKYSYKKHDSSCDVEANLILMEDGTYIYEDSSCSGENKAEGTYALGNNKIYLYNKLCQPVPDSTARQCEYPNCKNIIEFEYEEGKIISNIVMGSRENVTLEKSNE